MEYKLMKLAEMYRTSEVKYTQECYDSFAYDIIRNCDREDKGRLEKLWEGLKEESQSD